MTAILLNDLAAWQSMRFAGLAPEPDQASPGHRWLDEVYEPSVQRLRAALGRAIDPVQAYCDLLEVRWLLSERAGHDVGDEEAVAALAARRAPVDSAAGMALAESPTGVFTLEELGDAGSGPDVDRAPA